MENALSNARLLSKSLESTGWYRCVSNIHRPVGQHDYQKGEIAPTKEGETSADYNAGLSVFAFCLTDEFKQKYPHVKQESVSKLLRAKQYIIPNYPLPSNENTIEILRVVVRESMSLDLLDRLITDICTITEHIMNTDAVDLQACQPVDASTEKKHSSRGFHSHERHKSRRPMMSEGVHWAVC